MTPTTDFATPTIHRNGTSGKSLCEQYYQARIAVQQALKKLEQIDFNARDYYVQSEAAWQKAIEQNDAMWNDLQGVADCLEVIEMAIRDQIE
jgi:hypothetical protein